MNHRVGLKVIRRAKEKKKWGHAIPLKNNDAIWWLGARCQAETSPKVLERLSGWFDCPVSSGHHLHLFCLSLRHNCLWWSHGQQDGESDWYFGNPHRIQHI